MSRRLLLRELLVGCCRGVDGGVKPAVGWASRRIRAALNMVDVVRITLLLCLLLALLLLAIHNTFHAKNKAHSLRLKRSTRTREHEGMQHDAEALF